MTPAASASDLVPQRRKILRWLTHLAGGLLVLVAAGYAALPWWLPKDWLAGQLTEQLSSDLNRPVSIDRIHVGWIDGVVLEGFRIGGTPSSPETPLARVERIHCAFTPMTTMLTGRVNQIEIENPELFLTLDGGGESRLDNLGTRDGRRLPSLHFVIRDLVCHIQTARANETLVMDQLECRLEQQTGIVRFLGEVRAGRKEDSLGASRLRRLSIQAHVTVPRLKSGVKLGGEIEFEWHGLTLTDLPLTLIPKLPIEQVSGTTSGGITFTVQPDLGLDYEVAISLDGVHIRRPGVEHVAHVPDAQLRGSGFLDPNTDVILIHALSCVTPGVRFEGTGDGARPSLRFDLDDSDPSELHIAGTITDWPWLAREWPELGRWANEAGLVIAGPANLQLDINRQLDEDHVSLMVQADGASFQLTGADGIHLDAAAGLGKSAMWDVKVSRREATRVYSTLNLVVGGCTVAGSLDLPWIPPSEMASLGGSPTADNPRGSLPARLRSMLPEVRGHLDLSCRDLAEMVRVLPELGSWAGSTEWQGSAQAALSCEPGFTTSRVTLAVTLPGDAEVIVPGCLVKPRGEPLEASLGLTVRHGQVGRIDAPECVVSYGAGQFRLGGADAWCEYAVDFADASWAEGARSLSADVSWWLPLRVEQPQRLGEPWPEWTTWLGSQGIRDLAGSASVVLQGCVSAWPGDLVARWQAEVEADDLSVRWDDLIDKPSGRPLSVVLNHRYESLPGQNEHTLGFVLNQAGGRASAHVRLGKEDARDSASLCHQADVAISVPDVNDWLRLVPRAALALESYRPTGSLDAELTCVLSPEGHDLGLVIDATGMGFEIEGDPAAKKVAGVPATFRMHWRSAPDDSEPNAELWTLTGGYLRWGGSSLGPLSGSVAVGWPAGGNAALMPARAFLEDFWGRPSSGVEDTDRAPAGLPRVLAAEVQAGGTVVLDEAVLEFHPRVRGWCEQFKLVGGVIADLRLKARPDQVELIGVLDAQTLTFALPFESSLAPRIRKPPGAAARITFDLTVDDWLAGRSCGVGVRDLSVFFDDNEVRTHGEVRLAGDSVLELRWDRLDLQTHVRLLRPESIAEALPGSLLDIVGGRAELEWNLAGDRRRLALGASRAEFEDFLIGMGGEVIELDGRVSFDGQGVEVDRIEGAWGKSRLAVAGFLPLLDVSRPGRLTVVCDELSLPDLYRQWSLVRERLPKASASEEVSEEADGGDVLAGAVLEWLQRTELDVDLHIDTLAVTLPPEQLLTADVAWAGLNVRRGPVTVGFRGLVDGGLVTGEVVSHTQIAEPTYRLTYTADEIQPGPLVEGYLKRMFPGMTATGPLTLIDETNQKLLPLPGDPNFEVGEGELIIHGGSIEGRAAPLWMTRIFPGLNLAKFEFDYLHSWFSKMPSGRIAHQMIFQGRHYNVYMIGYSDADRRFEYEVGIDFLANYNSRYWADSGQGRIPLFVKTGWTDADGKLQDERVNFTPPRRLMETLFVQNNLVVTAYHAVRKRVLGEK